MAKPSSSKRAVSARVMRVVECLVKADIGAGARLYLPSEDLHPRVLPSGSDAVDAVIGVGGYPEGRLIIIHGGEASGKTTLALMAAAECLRRDGIVLYQDFEHKLDPRYALACGVDLSRLIICSPPHIEAGFEVLVKAGEVARDGAKDIPVLYVWDSLQAAISKRTFESDWDKADFPPEARAYSRGFAKFSAVLSETRGILLAVSQVRIKLAGFGPPQEKVGVGNAPLFYASLILQLKSRKARGSLSAGRIGEDVEIICRKNQVAMPYLRAMLQMEYGKGFDRPAGLLEAARIVGIAGKPGKDGMTTMRIGERVLKIEGSEAMSDMRAKTPDKYIEIEDAVRTHIGRATAEAIDEEARGRGDVADLKSEM